MTEATDVQTILCPYCGHAQAGGRQCARCRGLFEPLSRQATQNSMGPWQVRDESNPFTPGCSFETLRALVARGRVRADSVVRGPTTHQFWRRADETPGLSHFFGQCHACRATAHADDRVCSHCGESFAAPTDRQSLGLSPARALGAPRQESPLSPVTQTAAPMRAAPAGAQHAFAGPVLPEFVPIPSRARARGSQSIGLVAAIVIVGLATVGGIFVIRQSWNPAAPAEPSPPPVAETQTTPPPAPVAQAETREDAPATDQGEASEAWRDRLSEAGKTAASGREADVRAALEAVRSILAGFPEDQAPIEVVAEASRLERRLDEIILRRFVW